LLSAVGSWTEVLVGLSLIAIGLLGVKEARGWKAEKEMEELYSPSEKAATSHPVAVRGGNRAVVLNGILHGFSFDGTPSLAPALALPNIGAVLIFLLAYCSGTILAMSAVASVIGEGTLRVGETLDQV